MQEEVRTDIETFIASDEPKKTIEKLDFETFAKSVNGMILTNQTARSSRGALDYWGRTYFRYTKDEIFEIIEGDNLQAKIRLSRYFFERNGYYRQIVLYYATMLEYVGILIPNPLKDVKLSNNKLQKKYNSAINLVEKMNLPTFFTNCAWMSLVDGCYYGLIISETEDSFAVVDLPTEYCRTCYKDLYNNDLIEFNLTYFQKIESDEYRDVLLRSYPKFIRDAYKKFKAGKLLNPWLLIPASMGICFPFFDGKPALLNVIRAALLYDEVNDTLKDKLTDEIKKIIVQHIPHLAEGEFLLEPEEALEIHKGAVKMLENNPNVDVLTTYADVESIVSKTGNDNDASLLSRYEQNIYSQGGVSKELFAATGSSAIPSSQRVTLGIMMHLADKFSTFVTNFTNSKFSTPAINFKYTILPIAYFNEDEYLDNAFKLANSGFSFILPAIAMGLSQRDLANVKQLETDILHLDELLVPLQSAYNPTGEGPGRPKKALDEKSEKTVQNEQVAAGES